MEIPLCLAVLEGFLRSGTEGFMASVETVGSLGEGRCCSLGAGVCSLGRSGGALGGSGVGGSLGRAGCGD